MLDNISLEIKHANEAPRIAQQVLRELLTNESILS
jgi:hypothetical protein